MNLLPGILALKIDSLRVLLGLCIKYTDENGKEQWLSWELTPTEARHFADELSRQADRCEFEATCLRSPYLNCNYDEAEEYSERTLCGSIGLEGDWSKWIPGKPEKMLMNREYRFRKRNDLKMIAGVDMAAPGSERSVEIVKCLQCNHTQKEAFNPQADRSSWVCGKCGSLNNIDRIKITGGEEKMEDAG